MKKRMWAIGSALLLVALVLAGCATRTAEAPAVMLQPTAGADYYVSKEAEAAAGSPAAPGSAARELLGIERLVIRNATLDIVVRDTEATLTQIQALVKELGGYVVESSTYKYQEGLQASVTFRVPADQLDTALERIRNLATEVRHESITGQDVTEEYVDLESRLRHLEATEKRLETFLDQAEDTEAALAVYEQLRAVDAEIEQVKGRMKYLQESAALSMVTLSITPEVLAQPIQVGGWRPAGTLRDAFNALIKILQFLVDALIVIVVVVLPVLVVLGAPVVGLIFGIRALARRKRARKAARAAQSGGNAAAEQ